MLTKIRTFGDNVYLNFGVLNMSENGPEWESFTLISINSLLVYENKYYLEGYLGNCANKIVEREMIDYLDDRWRSMKISFLILINGS